MGAATCHCTAETCLSQPGKRWQSRHQHINATTAPTNVVRVADNGRAAGRRWRRGGNQGLDRGLGRRQLRTRRGRPGARRGRAGAAHGDDAWNSNEFQPLADCGQPDRHILDRACDTASSGRASFTACLQHAPHAGACDMQLGQCSPRRRRRLGGERLQWRFRGRRRAGDKRLHWWPRGWPLGRRRPRAAHGTRGEAARLTLKRGCETASMPVPGRHPCIPALRACSMTQLLPSRVPMADNTWGCSTPGRLGAGRFGPAERAGGQTWMGTMWAHLDGHTCHHVV